MVKDFKDKIQKNKYVYYEIDYGYDSKEDTIEAMLKDIKKLTVSDKALADFKKCVAYNDEISDFEAIKIETFATHSRDFSRELVATYVT